MNLPQGYRPGNDGAPSDIKRLLDTGIDVGYNPELDRTDESILQRIDSRIPWQEYKETLFKKLDQTYQRGLRSDDEEDRLLSTDFDRFQPIYNEETGEFTPVNESPVPISAELNSEYALRSAEHEDQNSSDLSKQTILYVSKRPHNPAPINGLENLLGAQIMKVDSLTSAYAKLARYNISQDKDKAGITGIIIDTGIENTEGISDFSYAMLNYDKIKQKAPIVYLGTDHYTEQESFTAMNGTPVTAQNLEIGLKLASAKAELYRTNQAQEEDYENLRLIATKLGLQDTLSELVTQMQRDMPPARKATALAEQMILVNYQQLRQRKSDVLLALKAAELLG